MTDFLRYRILTGPDDKAFCERVSAALDQGYQLYGSPAITFNGERCIVAQAVILQRSASVAPQPPSDERNYREESE
jgi:hypothetical protein